MEFEGEALDVRAFGNGGQLALIRPGQPVANACTEPLAGRLATSASTRAGS